MDDFIIVHLYWDSIPSQGEEANFSLEMTALGKLCCVALPRLASLGVSGQLAGSNNTKQNYI